jgi:hypothetical protein
MASWNAAEENVSAVTAGVGAHNDRWGVDADGRGREAIRPPGFGVGVPVAGGAFRLEEDERKLRSVAARCVCAGSTVRSDPPYSR